MAGESGLPLVKVEACQSQASDDSMNWQPTIPPTLTEDLLYHVIKYRLDNDLLDLCDDPKPRNFVKIIATAYLKSVLSFSRVNTTANFQVQRIVARHHGEVLARRRALFSRLQEAWYSKNRLRAAYPHEAIPLWSCSRDLNGFTYAQWESMVTELDDALDELSRMQQALEKGLSMKPLQNKSDGKIIEHGKDK